MVFFFPICIIFRSTYVQHNAIDQEECQATWQFVCHFSDFYLSTFKSSGHDNKEGSVHIFLHFQGGSEHPSHFFLPCFQHQPHYLTSFIVPQHLLMSESSLIFSNHVEFNNPNTDHETRYNTQKIQIFHSQVNARRDQSK